MPDTYTLEEVAHRYQNGMDQVDALTASFVQSLCSQPLPYGWAIGGWRSREQLLAHLLHPDRFGPGGWIVESRIVSCDGWYRHWYLLRKSQSTPIAVGVDTFCERGGDGWGYFAEHERDFLYHYDCPQALLRAAGPCSAKAQRWRELCMAHQAREAQLRDSVGVGVVLTVGVHAHRLVSKLPGRGGWLARRLTDGCQVELSRKQVSDAASALLQAGSACCSA